MSVTLARDRVPWYGGAPVKTACRPEAATYARIALEFWRQAYMVSEAEARREGRPPSGGYLGAARLSVEGVALGITLHPADLTALLSGEIPPEYAPEEVAARISDVCALGRAAQESPEAWAARMRDLVQRAAAEVDGLVGGLPGPVQEACAQALAMLRPEGAAAG